MLTLTTETPEGLCPGSPVPRRTRLAVPQASPLNAVIGRCVPRSSGARPQFDPTVVPWCSGVPDNKGAMRGLLTAEATFYRQGVNCWAAIKAPGRRTVSISRGRVGKGWGSG